MKMRFRSRTFGGKAGLWMRKFQQPKANGAQATVSDSPAAAAAPRRTNILQSLPSHTSSPPSSNNNINKPVIVAWDAARDRPIFSLPSQKNRSCTTAAAAASSPESCAPTEASSDISSSSSPNSNSSSNSNHGSSVASSSKKHVAALAFHNPTKKQRGAYGRRRRKRLLSATDQVELMDNIRMLENNNKKNPIAVDHAPKMNDDDAEAEHTPAKVTASASDSGSAKEEETKRATVSNSSSTNNNADDLDTLNRQREYFVQLDQSASLRVEQQQPQSCSAATPVSRPVRRTRRKLNLVQTNAAVVLQTEYDGYVAACQQDARTPVRWDQFVQHRHTFLQQRRTLYQGFLDE